MRRPFSGSGNKPASAGPRPLAWPMLWSALAGAAAVFAFAPFGYWPLQLLSLAWLFYQVGIDMSPKRATLLGWAYGFGWSVAAIHWLYIAMNRFGGMAGPLAALAVCLMGAYMGLFAALATGVASWLRRRWSLPLMAFALVLLPLCWGLSEWVRGWLFTGFPWVVSGYAHTNGPLHGYAPVLGVYGTGALAALCAATLTLLTQARRRIAALAVLGVTVIGGLGLGQVAWTHAEGKPIKVRLLQGNVAQSEKFSPERVEASLKLFQDMVRAAPADLIATPETAIVLFPQQLPPDYLPSLHDFARQSGSSLMLGMPLADSETDYANSAVGVGPDGASAYRYDKHHLVPFGEFVPAGFRWFVDLMRIPLGDFHRGNAIQAPFVVKDQAILPNVCYEDLFGEEIATQIRDGARPATILLNVSNLAWYGESIAIAQHLQISRMRSLETGRPMLRATNTGATAVIDGRGNIAAQLTPYTRGTLAYDVQGMAGNTPYILCGNFLFLGLAALGLTGAWFSGRKYRAARAKSDILATSSP